MHCESCDDEIVSDDPRYEFVEPHPAGDKRQVFCSVKCLNAAVAFSDEEIESLMRQKGYDVPPDDPPEWRFDVVSEIRDSQTVKGYRGWEDGWFFLFSHYDEQNDVEIYHDPDEDLYQINVYKWGLTDEGEKIGLTELNRTHTGVMQRALWHAENEMEKVENGYYEP